MRVLNWLQGLVLGSGRPLEEFGVIEIREVAEMDEVLRRSGDVPVFVLKHSTTCPISASAHRRVAEYMRTEDSVPVYLVKVIESRPLSNEIAKYSGVKHESPQVILFKDGKPCWSASHGAITPEAMDAALDAVDD